MKIRLRILRGLFAAELVLLLGLLITTLVLSHTSEYHDKTGNAETVTITEDGTIQVTERTSDTLAYLREHKILLRSIIYSTVVMLLLMVALLMSELQNNGIREYQAKLKMEQEKANIANLSKSFFLMNLSRDIRTPMNAILGFTEMAQKYVDNREQTLDYLDKIRVSGEYLLNLLNDIIDVAKLESGDEKLRPEPLDLEEEYKSITIVTEQEAREHGLRFSAECNIWDGVVDADVRRLNQLLFNLLSNAIKFTKAGGGVSFKVTQIPCEQDRMGLYTFRVSDTGTGMSEDLVSILNGEGPRDNSAPASGMQGSGLGVSIIRQLVDQMHGKLTVDSQKEKGTTIVCELMLPVLPKTALKKAMEAEASRMDFRGMHALLVEDNDLNREICRDMLQDYGIIVEEATDGDLAVEAVKRYAPAAYDFILMDIQMPRMNGYDATKLIRAQVSGRAPEIIALTANAFESDRQKAQDAGMDDFLSKPVGSRDLESKLNEAWKRRI